MNSHFRKWMLPEGVVEALPSEASKLNTLTQTALDTFSRWGYQPLRPPIVEYADTFLSSNRSDNLDGQTIQFKDEKSGKQLGFRADITPQIARIDAHYLSTDKVARYAYAGEVVRSYPEGNGSARNPTIIGAELLGSASQQADIEIVGLLIAFLNQLDLADLTIELGNIDIVVELLTVAGVDESQFASFFEALVVKDKARLQQLSQRSQLGEKASALLEALTDLYGGLEVLEQAKSLCADYPQVLLEIERLAGVAKSLQQQYGTINFHLDLADVRGYGYHNGLIFSAYINGVWKAIARGGRYDYVGNHFRDDERLRPSTGFSCDLNLIAPLLPSVIERGRLICCELDDDSPELVQFIAQLRGDGDIVIQQFDDGVAPNRQFTHRLIKTSLDFRIDSL